MRPRRKVRCNGPGTGPEPTPACRGLRLLFLSLLLPSLMLGGFASRPPDPERPVSHALKDTDDTRVGQIAGARLSHHPAGHSGSLPLTSGIDAFVAPAVLAEKAGRSIDARYHRLHGDLTGHLFVYKPLEPADRRFVRGRRGANGSTWIRTPSRR